MKIKRKRTRGWKGTVREAAAFALLLLVAGAVARASETTAAESVSTAADRRELAITVYNQGFGLVREIREVHLGTGRTRLQFRDVADQIQPETLLVRSRGGSPGLRVLEQDYRHDLLTPEALLHRYVGRTVRVHRWNEALGREEVKDAELLSVAGGVVLRLDGRVTTGVPGRLSFPDVPAGMTAAPVLVWLVDAPSPSQRIEVTYITRGLGWTADYVLVLDQGGAKGDLTGWVTLNNTSGADYEDAGLKLVAGQVQRAAPQAMMVQRDVAAAPMAAGPQFGEEGFAEYHLYTLKRPTTLRQGEQKQVLLLEADGVKVAQRFVFRGQPYWYRSAVGSVAKDQKVGVFLEIGNVEENQLGVPLPAGTFRVYRADASGAPQFAGEDRIDHTPRDETLRIRLGEAFDVVGDRVQTEFRSTGRCSSESSWEITLRNHKDEEVEVEVLEPAGGEWRILSSSLPARRVDARTLALDVEVPARGEAKVTYSVRTSWC